MGKKFLLVAGDFAQCEWASQNYNKDLYQAYCAKSGNLLSDQERDCSPVYCAKYNRIMDDAWQVSMYCHGKGGCDS